MQVTKCVSAARTMFLILSFLRNFLGLDRKAVTQRERAKARHGLQSNRVEFSF